MAGWEMGHERYKDEIDKNKAKIKTRDKGIYRAVKQLSTEEVVSEAEVTLPNNNNKGKTKEQQKITTNPGPVDIKFDDKLVTPPQKYFSKDEQIKNEAVQSELKHIRDKEAKDQNKQLGMFKGKHAPSHASLVQKEEKDSDVPFDKPYKTMAKDVKDKSGATHTPMSRAKDLARQSFKKLKKETMMGKISN